MTLTLEARDVLNSVPALIDKTFPIPGRFRGALPSDVAELSRLLTGARGDRSLSYLSRPNFLSAYLRYFLPWNLYRLCHLLPALDLRLSAGDKIIDLGSGPLTFVTALWISRPDLRSVPLEFNCIDRCAGVLEAGKKFFASLSNAVTPGCSHVWKINTIRKDVDFRKETSVMRNGALVCAVNIFNEIYERLPHSNSDGLQRMAANVANFMHAMTAEGGSILTVEPGVPQSGRFISFLRDAFLKLNRQQVRLPLSPCPHAAACPMLGNKQLGGKKRWCHFAFEADSAPKELHSLSAAARLPKDRLVLSYLHAGPAIAKTAVETTQPAFNEVRVISDAFSLPNNRFGRYCCSGRGLVLITGEKKRIEKIVSGSLVTPIFAEDTIDEKSGALLAEVP